MGKEDKVFAVILVGGKGKRLRPLSTNKKPKAFLSVTRNRKTMFKATADRIRKIITLNNIFVSANRTHARMVKKDFPGIGNNLILEPVSRNTAPAIALAAERLTRRAGDAVMVVVPADQYIPDEKKYLRSIKSGIEFAKENDCLVILGLKPVFPSVQFGYIKIEKEKGKRKKAKGRNIFKVERFTEKPDLKTAKKFLRHGGYLWNAGIFIFRTKSILKAVRKLEPDIFNGLFKLNGKNINSVYKNFPDISIDYAVIEKADNVYCVKGSYRWEDIGSFDSLRRVLKNERRGFIESGGRVMKIL